MDTQTPTPLQPGKLYRRFKRPPFSLLAALILSLGALACAIPLTAHYSFAALILLVTSALFLIATARSRLVTVVIGLVTLMLVLSGGYSALAITLSFLCLICGGAFFRILTPLPALYILGFALFGFSYVLSGGRLLSALLSIAFLPTAAILAYDVARGRARISTLCRAGIALGITLASLAALALYIEYGKLSVDQILTLLDELRVGIESYFADQLASQPAELAELIPSGTISLMVNSLFNLLPAYLILVVLVVVFFAHCLCLILLRGKGFSFLLTSNALAWNPSLPAALLLLLSYGTMIVFALNGTSTLLASVAENIYLVLSPLFFIVGVSRFLRPKPNASRPRFSLWTILLILLFPNVALLIAILGGAFSTVGRHMATLITPKQD